METAMAVACVAVALLLSTYEQLLVRSARAFDARYILATKTIGYMQAKKTGSTKRLERLCQTRVKKFSECLWRLILYTAMVGFGSTCVRQSVLFMDVYDFFDVWPLDSLDSQIKCFYYLETGLYLHLTINHFFEIRRKDFLEMLLHHAATLGLLAWSWLFNFTRVRLIFISSFSI